MRALIFGASGAVGSAVARRACELGHQVHAAVRAHSDLRRLPSASQAAQHAIEMADADAVSRLIERVQPDWMLMAAFPAHAPGPERSALQRIMEANLQGLFRGLSATGYDSSLTFIGSALAYHHEAPGQGGQARPRSARGDVKLAESRMAARLARERSLPLTELRLFTGYGTWEQPARLVPALLRAALGGERVRLASQGTRRDWTYYQDVADACLASAQWRGREPRVLDVCSGDVHDAHQVAELLVRITGKPLIAEGAFRREESYGDATSGRLPTRAELDWRPRVDLASGLEHCWRWARSPVGRRWLRESESACA